MAVKFFNIRSGETQTAETEPHITAMWASSDHSPNITQGQDFGWRLAPEVVVEMKKIKQDGNILQVIASRINKSVEDITEPDILSYISARTAPDDAPVASDVDYADIYDDEIRRQLAEADELKADGEVAPAEPQESLEDLQKRVELEERLAAARAVPEAPAEPQGPEDTTTTTVTPDTTTTTTKTEVK